MTTLLVGKSVDEAEAIFGRFQELVTSQVDAPVDLASLGKLAVFAGVSEFPARVKCASLAWHVMRAALHDETQTVTTE